MMQMLRQRAAASANAADPARRLIEPVDLKFSEILSAMSVALDITQGHPEGHCMRTGLIGMRLARELTLTAAERAALFYALLLKDLGCSSNAAKIAHLFGGDDRKFKRGARMIDWTKQGACLQHCWGNLGAGGSTAGKVVRVAGLLLQGPALPRRIREIRCERGAALARMLNLPEATAVAILHADEMWNGRGAPRGLAGDRISLLGRICGLAQTVEVFVSAYGLPAACQMARERRGRWFDPHLVDALLSFREEADFWRGLQSDDLLGELGAWAPEDVTFPADDACLDRVAGAFAAVVDAKSPWTFEHSTRVAELAVGIAQTMGLPKELVRDLGRAALLHDVGKLGVSNTILDKPGKPTDEEYAEIRRHPEFTHRILRQVAAFGTLAEVAGAHHERLDGRGYHLGVQHERIRLETRILTVADVYEAMSADRPYRAGMPRERIEAILTADVGKGIDGECLRALQTWLDAGGLPSRISAQHAAVEHAFASP